MRRIVIGIGNPVRGDDAAGFEVARRLRRVESHPQMSGSFELMDLWEGADEVILVDAARSGADPGTIHRFEAHSRPLPAQVLSTSTHAIGIPETIEMARRLGRLPERVVVYGIEVSELRPGTGMSPQVEEAVQAVTREIDHA